MTRRVLALSLLLSVAFALMLGIARTAVADEVDDELVEVEEPIILGEPSYDDDDELLAMGYNNWRGTLTEGEWKTFHLNDSDNSDEYWSVAIADFTIDRRSRVDLITVYQPTNAGNGSFSIKVTEDSGKFEGRIERKLNSSKRVQLTSGINDKKCTPESIPAGHYRIQYTYHNSHDWDGRIDFEIRYVVKPLFKDVPKTHWAAGVIAEAVDKGYISGYSDSAFGTDDPITRGQVATILWNIEGCKSGGSDNPFSDVPSGKYYTEAIKWVARAGIVKGYADGTFKPENPVTRQELATMLYNYAVKYKGFSSKGNDPSSYAGMSDRDSVSAYARPAMGWCFKRGVISGSDNKINPGGRATRAEAAKMFVKVAKLVHR